jgi:signal peptidase
LTAAAVAGAACLLLTAAAVAFDITLIMFRTGSMAPTIPAGSLAVVRALPAVDARVGVVVTVDRGEGALPVTHRVVRVASASATAGATELVLKGDANSGPDPVPYRVERVRKVLWSTPRAGWWLEALRSPYALGGTTLVVSALVTWAFWPRRVEPVAAS